MRGRVAMLWDDTMLDDRVIRRSGRRSVVSEESMVYFFFTGGFCLARDEAVDAMYPGWDRALAGFFAGGAVCFLAGVAGFFFFGFGALLETFLRAGFFFGLPPLPDGFLPFDPAPAEIVKP